MGGVWVTSVRYPSSFGFSFCISFSFLSGETDPVSSDPALLVLWRETVR